MVLPADVAFRFEELPTAMVEGVAVTEVGGVGKVAKFWEVATEDEPALFDA